MRKVFTVTQLVTVLNDFATAIDNHQQIDAVFLGLSKAFDRVPQNLLLARLTEIGLPEIIVPWIKAYLENRTQFVECDCVRSDSLCVFSGVPQSSVFGPLLFLVYINDISKDIGDGVKVKLFADDFVVYSVIKSGSCQAVLNENVCKLVGLCDKKGMEIIFSKSVSAVFTTKKESVYSHLFY